MNKAEYQNYLKSRTWKSISSKIKDRDKWKCRLCNSGLDLHVHHRSYEFIGNESKHLEDLITICSRCHSLFHGKPHAPTAKAKEKAVSAHIPKEGRVHKQQKAIKVPMENSFKLTKQLIKNLRTDSNGFTGDTSDCFKGLGINCGKIGWAKRAIGTVVTKEWYLKAEAGRHQFRK